MAKADDAGSASLSEVELHVEKLALKTDDALAAFYALNEAEQKVDAMIARAKKLKARIAEVTEPLLKNLDSSIKTQTAQNQLGNVVRVVNEFLQTQVSYVNSLQRIVGKESDEPSLESTLTNFATTNNLKAEAAVIKQALLFLPPILNVEKRFLVELQKAVSVYDKKQKLGDLVSEWATSHFFVYTDFVTHKDTNEKLLMDLFNAPKSPFAEFQSKTLALSANAQGMFVPTFFSCFQSAVQRLPRIILLLREIMKNLPTDHHDQAALKKAQGEVDKVLKGINVSIDERTTALLYTELQQDKRMKGAIVNNEGQPRKLLTYLGVERIWSLASDSAISVHSNTRLLLFDDRLIAEDIYAVDGSYHTMKVPLIWLHFDIEKASLDDLGFDTSNQVELSNTFKIRSPKATWIVRVGRDAFKNFGDRIAPLLGVTDTTKLSDFATGLRDGTQLQLRFKGIGTYAGKWQDALPHLQGVFTREDGAVFTGLWESSLNVGFGTVKLGDRTIVDGWRFSIRPSLQKTVVEANAAAALTGQETSASDETFEGGITTCSEDEDTKHNRLWSNTELSEEDWKLMKAASDQTYSLKKGEYVLRQGDVIDGLYLVSSGAVKTEKATKEGWNVTISTHSPNAAPFLGLDAFLNDREKYSASAIVTSDVAEVLSFPIALLGELFTNHIGLHYRLAVFIAKQLWVTLREFEKDTNAKKERKLLEIKEATVYREEAKFYDKFGFPKSEKVIRWVPAKNGPSTRGIVYISSNHVCFLSEILGIGTNFVVFVYCTFLGHSCLELASKERINLLDVAEVRSASSDKAAILIKTVDKKSFRFKFKSVDVNDEVLMLIQNLLAIVKKKDFGREVTVHHSDSVSLSRERTSAALPVDSAQSSKLRSKLNVINPSELQLLVRGTEEISFVKDAVIIKQGQAMSSLYFVKSGTLLVKIPLPKTELKDSGSDDTIVAQMREGSPLPGDFFGESVFISSEHNATATILARSDQVVLNAVSSDYVNILFARFPAYAPKFYKFLGESIQRRLMNRIAERKGFDVSSFA